VDCCSPGDSSFDRQFDARHAADHLRAYREKGPVGTTRALIDALAAGAYMAVAREEAERQGHADRVHYLAGDFVDLADAVDPADLVALDRVICCYEDMAALVGLVYPRDSWLGRLGVAFLNAQLRLSRSSFRAYVHRTSEVDAILAAHGLVKVLHQTTLIWQIALFERPSL
jgi:hypothetical protein